MAERFEYRESFRKRLTRISIDRGVITVVRNDKTDRIALASVENVFLQEGSGSFMHAATIELTNGRDRVRFGSIDTGAHRERYAAFAQVAAAVLRVYAQRKPHAVVRHGSSLRTLVLNAAIFLFAGALVFPFLAYDNIVSDDPSERLQGGLLILLVAGIFVYILLAPGWRKPTPIADVIARLASVVP